MSTDAVLSIDEVARRFGITASALRYYDEIGLLVPMLRRSRRRHYGLNELRRLALIQLLQNTARMSLGEIAEIIRADRQSRDVRSVIRARIALLRDQIAATRSAERYLTHRLACPRSNPIDECPILAGELEEQLRGLLADERDPEGEASRR